MKPTLTKTALATAMVAALGVSAPLSANTLKFSFDGLMTMLDPAGNPLVNTSTPYYDDPTWGYGRRTQIQGTLTFDLLTMTGTGTVVPFSFFNQTQAPLATARDVYGEVLNIGLLGEPSLVLFNLLFDWNGNYGIPVSLVLDAQGLFNNIIPGMLPGQTIDQSSCSNGQLINLTPCAIPASDGISKGKYPIGPVPIATTSWDTTTIPGSGLESNPSGTTPLIEDPNGIGGSPMITGPFPGFSANFDITSLTLIEILPSESAVPVPAAAWLFGSGLIGLVGIARRKQSN